MYVFNFEGTLDDRSNGERSQGPRVPSKHIISSDSITVNKELGMGEFGVVQQGVWTNDGERVRLILLKNRKLLKFYYYYRYK